MTDYKSLYSVVRAFRKIQGNWMQCEKEFTEDTIFPIFCDKYKTSNIFLSNEGKFCPWSLMIKECPFLSFFLVLLRFCRGFWCSYHWPEQAVKCSACLGRAINCVMTYMSLEEGSFHSSVVVLLKPTLKHCGKLEKN